MLSMHFPDIAGLFYDVFQKTTSAHLSVSWPLAGFQEMGATDGEKGNVYVEWKWFIGPLPLPLSIDSLIPAST